MSDVYEYTPHGKGPKWAKTIYKIDGEIFVPASFNVSEQEVFLCALSDGTAIVMPSNLHSHPLFSMDWVEKEFPNCGLDFDNVRKRIKEIDAQEDIASV